MKIALLNWRGPAHPRAGGAERYTAEIMQRLVGRGHEVVWVSSRGPGLAQAATIDGMRIDRHGSKVSVYTQARRWWQRDGRHQSFDVIIDQVNTRGFNAPAWPDRPPVVALIHQTCEDIWDHTFPQPLAWLGRQIERRWLQQYRDTPVVTVSASTARALARFGVHDVHMLGQGGTEAAAVPGVEDVLQNRRTAAPARFVWCGRMVRNKRPLAAIAAFERLRQRVPNATLDMIGTGPLLSHVRAAAGRCDGLRVHGRVDDQTRDELLRNASALVVTSVREGWGLGVSEAASVGTPTIGYDVAGLRDSIPASGGLLTVATPAALATAMALHAHGRLALQARVATDSWDVLADRWEKLLAQQLQAMSVCSR